MKKTINFIVMALLFTVSTGYAAKIDIAVKPLDVAEGLSAMLGPSLSDIIETTLQGTGKFSTRSRQAIMQEMEFIMSTGCSGEKCIMALGGKLQVSMVCFGRVSRIGQIYTLNVKVMSLRAGEMGEIIVNEMTEAKSETALIEKAKQISLEISVQIPQEGVINYISGENIIIDLGSDNNLKPGDILDLVRSEDIRNDKGELLFSKRNEIGKIKILQVNKETSLVAVEESSTEIKVGDIVKVKEEKLEQKLAKLRAEKEKEKREEEKRAAREKKAQRKREKAAAISESGSLMKLKVGSFSPKEEVFETLYGNSTPFGIDAVFPLSDYLDFFWKNTFIINTIDDTVKPASIDTAMILMYAPVFGIQASYNYGGFIPYAGLGIKVNLLLESVTYTDTSLEETSESTTFSAYGPEYTFGLTVMLTESFGLFGEYCMATTKTGPDKIDIDGTSQLFGVVFKMRNMAAARSK